MASLSHNTSADLYKHITLMRERGYHAVYDDGTPINRGERPVDAAFYRLVLRRMRNWGFEPTSDGRVTTFAYAPA